jgi:hypothetical protein
MPQLGVGIDPAAVTRCSKEEAEYLTGKAGAQNEGPPPFNFTIWINVIKQPASIKAHSQHTHLNR